MGVIFDVKCVVVVGDGVCILCGRCEEIVGYYVVE